MNVLVIGGGGREHALCWKLAQSPRLTRLYCSPGNGGIAAVAECLTLDSDDHDAVIAWCRDHAIDLVVIGPEAPLVGGLSDALKVAGIRAFGPSAAAAQLEGSKAFTKQICDRAGIPTAGYAHFTEAEAAKAYIAEKGAPIVIKADGLAAGKGVTVAMTRADAMAAVEDCFAGRFGEAGAAVVVEEFLEGEEASFFALVDGQTALPLATAQDHKRALDGDNGPNTGGMGAYSPAPVMSQSLCAQVMAEIIQPTVAAMAQAGTPFTGVLYAGLMITKNGPKLIEYNVRFGDPECQVLMMRLRTDLLDLLLAACDQGLADAAIAWHEDCALTVVMANQGYPERYQKGDRIAGLEAAAGLEQVQVFHAGTQRQDDAIIATGGRVLNVTALGASVAEAQARAYQAVDLIDWPHAYCRRDIGWRAIAREA